MGLCLWWFFFFFLEKCDEQNLFQAAPNSLVSEISLMFSEQWISVYF